MRTEAEIENALEIILTAADGAKSDEEKTPIAGIAIALAWMLGVPDISEMFEATLRQCEEMRDSHRRPKHRSASIGKSEEA